MKKLLLVAAIGVAGLVSAKGKAKEFILMDGFKKEGKFVEKSKLKNSMVYVWVTVVSPCGAVYSLDISGYSDAEELMNDVYYFNGQKCGGNTGDPRWENYYV